MALWGGRFEAGVAEVTQEFGASLPVDKHPVSFTHFTQARDREGDGSGGAPSVGEGASGWRAVAGWWVLPSVQTD